MKKNEPLSIIIITNAIDRRGNVEKSAREKMGKDGEGSVLQQNAMH